MKNNYKVLNMQNVGRIFISLICIAAVLSAGCTSTPNSKIVSTTPTTQPFTPITLTGSGYGSPKFTIPSDGNYQIDFQNSRSIDGSFFYVEAKSLSGSDNRWDMIYSGFGNKKGSKILNLKTGSYFLDVTSYGDWTFIISQA